MGDEKKDAFAEQKIRQGCRRGPKAELHDPVYSIVLRATERRVAGGREKIDTGSKGIKQHRVRRLFLRPGVLTQVYGEDFLLKASFSATVVGRKAWPRSSMVHFMGTRRRRAIEIYPRNFLTDWSGTPTLAAMWQTPKLPVPARTQGICLYPQKGLAVRRGKTRSSFWDSLFSSIKSNKSVPKAGIQGSKSFCKTATTPTDGSLHDGQRQQAEGTR